MPQRVPWRITGARGISCGRPATYSYDILAVVGVGRDEGIFGGKEGPAVIGKEEAVLAGLDIGGRRGAARNAGDANDIAGRGFVSYISRWPAFSYWVTWPNVDAIWVSPGVICILLTIGPSVQAPKAPISPLQYGPPVSVA